MFMTKNILRNLFSKKATRLYPVTTRPDYPDVRGELVNDIEKCIFCKSCSLKCPSQCISVDPKAGTWELDVMACLVCGICVDACPTKCLSMQTAYRKPFTERQIQTLQGTPRAAKKKAEEAPAEAGTEENNPAQ